MMVRHIVLGIVVGLALSTGALAKHGDRDAAFHALETESTTPSVAWGLPLKGGAIRVLFIAPQWGLRDIAALAQSIEIDYQTCLTWDSTHLGGQEPGIPTLTEDQVRRTLLDGLGGKLDVIVLGNIDLGVLPDDVVGAIQTRVKDGAGLVVARYGGGVSPSFQQFLDSLTPSESTASVTRGVGETLTPEWATGLGFVKSGTLEKGRAVQLNYAEGTSAFHFLIPPLADPLRSRDEHLGTYLSLVARAVRWAAAREPKIWIEAIEEVGPPGPKDDEIPPGLPDEYVQQMKEAAIRPDYQSYSVKLNAPAGKAYTVVAQAREPGRGVCITYPNLPSLKKGAAAYALEMPIGPGSYFLDLWLMDKSDVIEWHTQAITVKTWPQVENLSYSKGYLLPNDSLSISLDVRPRLTNPRPCAVLARATDSIGRVVSETTVKVDPKGGSVQLSLGFADLISDLVKVEVFAAAPLGQHLTRFDLDRAAYSHMYLPVRAPHRDGSFELAIEAGHVEEYNARAVLKSLAALGVDTVALAGYPESDGASLAPALDAARFALLRQNLRAIPEVARCMPRKVENDTVLKPCPSDPSFVDQVEKAIRLVAPAFWVAGSSVFSLGNPCVLSATGQNLCQCPVCLEGFRAMVRQQYGELAPLNQAWGSGFEEWDAVMPPTLASVREGGHPAGWLDFRIYMDTVFAGTALRASDCVHGLAHDAHAGLTLLPGSEAHRGHDWTTLAPELDAVFVPFSAGAGFLGTWGAPGPSRRYRALLTDTLDEGLAGWMPWYAAFSGFQSLWQRRALEGAAVTPGGRVQPAFVRMCESVGELRTGLDALLFSATPVKPTVAIYLSQSSQYFNQAAPLSETMQPSTATDTFARLVAATARPYAFVSRQQALQGALRDYPVVVLPMARVLADDEMAALKTFVDEGGSLIADWLPGDRDSHGVPRAESPVNALFGVTRNGSAQPSAPRQVDATFAFEKTNVAGEAPQAVVDSSLVANAGGVAHGDAGGVPVWITQGKCLLFNHVSASPSWGFARLLDRYLESVGAARSVPLAELVPRVECQALQFGDTRVFTMLREPSDKDAPSKLVLGAEQDRAYYDLRAGKRLSSGKHVDVRLGSDGAAVVAALPYEVRGLGLQTLDRVAQGRRLPLRVTVKTDKAKSPGRHLVHVTFSRMGGTALSHYDPECRVPRWARRWVHSPGA